MRKILTVARSNWRRFTEKLRRSATMLWGAGAIVSIGLLYLAANRWPAVSSVIEAIAAAVIAWFTWVQVRRDGARIEGERQAALAKVRGHAFLLRRRLREIIGANADASENLLRWVDSLERLNRVDREFGALENLAHDMRTQTIGAPVHVQQGVDFIFVRTMAACRRLKTWIELGPVDGSRWFDRYQYLTNARADIEDALAKLEEHDLSGDLISADQLLDAQRADEDPWRQLALAIMAEDDQRRAQAGDPPEVNESLAPDGRE